MNNPAKLPKKINHRLYYFNKEPYSLFLHYAEGHPVNIKEKFSMGHIRVFDQSRMFTREIFSTEHLNQNIQWGHKYFAALLASFHNFQILSREDPADQALDFIVRGKIDEEESEVLLKTVIEADFGGDIQKQFWKQFQNYNEFKNKEIQDYQQQSRQNALNIDRKLETIKKYCDSAELQKKKLLGRLSALLTQKVNKLRQYEEDYSIELLQDKFKKVQQNRVMSTYQEEAEFHGTLFQPSQDFR